MKLKPIEDQVVVVCGASSGMGRMAALEFARRGAKVVASSRSQEGLESLASEVEAEGGEITTVIADVSDYTQVRAIGKEAVRKYGRLDTWAHFAATSVYAPFRETTPEEFARVMDVNLLGAVYAAMVALPLLSKQGGALIEISSLEAQVGIPCQSAYTASKQGMRGFMDVLRMELRHERVPVSVTNIMPSAVNTPFFNHARSRLGFVPKPPTTMYQPETVVRAVLHAAQHPVDEIVIGSSGWLFLLAKRLMPRLTDVFVTWLAYRKQKAPVRRAICTGDNIFEPGSRDTRTHGDFEQQAWSGSAFTWMQLHPGLTRGIGGALLAGAATALVWAGTREK